MRQTPRPLGALAGRDHGVSTRALPAPIRFHPLEDRPHEAPEVAPQISRRSGRLSMALIGRAMARHKWVALIVWVTGSAGLIVAADRKIRPEYEALSVIKVEPGRQEPGKGSDFEVFKQTQARRVANPSVIQSALRNHPDLERLTILAGPDAPETWIRRHLVAQVIPGTDLIQVALKTEKSQGSDQVVDAVVQSFLETVRPGEAESVEKGRRLQEARDARNREVEQRRAEIVALATKLGAVDSARARDRDAVALEQYKTLSNQLLQTDLELMATQSRLDQLRERSQSPDLDPGKLDAAVIAAFYADPQVVALKGQIDAARDELAQVDRVARNGGDVPRGAARKTIDDGQKQIDNLWIRKKPALAQAARTSSGHEVELRQVSGRVAELKATLARMNERLGKLNAQTRNSGTDELTLEFARHDLARTEAVLDTLTRETEQHHVEAQVAGPAFHQEFPARVEPIPDGHRRIKAMALAPITMLLGVVSLLVLAELRSGRVMGPEDLPTSLQPRVLGVLGVLPRPGTRNHSGSGRRHEDFARFVQSLDHLRVVLCDRRDHRSRRCLLITSAMGGEGKTTLAAQLAERCVSAGLTTLLVDADLRNPTLSRMFDRTAQRGLADVLRGESSPEDAIHVIGDAGGVHFLAAGTDRADPGRLLHGEALGRFLARARESFDMVIVDAPPVLPVPDALTIGRWVDGAILSVRSDTSRFPLVEQADHRLAGMGVPVLGAVVNGVRNAGRAYGMHGGSASVVTTLDT